MARRNSGYHCMLPVVSLYVFMLTIARIKILALIVFFILAICISTGGIGPQPIGFKYWHDPGPFADSINGVARTFVVAGTLYAGTEM
jgi:amino acid transporter